MSSGRIDRLPLNLTDWLTDRPVVCFGHRRLIMCDIKGMTDDNDRQTGDSLCYRRLAQQHLRWMRENRYALLMLVCKLKRAAVTAPKKVSVSYYADYECDAARWGDRIQQSPTALRLWTSFSRSLWVSLVRHAVEGILNFITSMIYGSKYRGTIKRANNVSRFEKLCTISGHIM